MKKGIIFGAVCLFALGAFAKPILNSRGKVGTVTSCTVDTDVDTAFATTVDADSAAAQKVLNIAATTNLIAGDVLLIDRAGDGNGKEICVVASVSAGVSATCVDNLVYTHAGATADDVILTNRIGPLNPGEHYAVMLVTSGEALQAGRFIQGDAYVTAEFSYGLHTAAQADGTTIIKATENSAYISFKTATENAVGRACRIQ